MSKTHWKECFDKEYIGAWFCMDEDKTLTVDHVVKKETITGENGRKDTQPVIYFKERGDDGKPLKMVGNATNMKTLETISGTPYIQEWPGLTISVYADPNVVFGKEKVGGIRIRPQAPRTVYHCEQCGQEVTEEVINGKKYTARQMASNAKKKFGRVLCYPCIQDMKEAENESN